MNRTFMPRASWQVACALGLALTSGMGLAGDWDLSESTSFSLTSVERTGSNDYSGLVLQASPTINLNGRGGRLTGDMSLRPTFSVGGGTTDPRFLTNEGYGRFRLEAIEDVFFLGANFNAQLNGTTGVAGNVDAINVNSDGAQSYSVGLTPEFRFHLNRYADVVSNNSIDYVWYHRDDRDQGDSSSSARVHLGIRNGRHFGPLSWRADASRSRTHYESRDDYNSSVTAGAGYRLNAQWRFSGDVGYETNDVQTNRSDTDGITWNVGTTWTPNPRNSLSVSYGDRYFGETYSADYTHRSRRTQLAIGVSRDIDNQRNEQLVDSLFFLADADGNPVVDPSTGNPIVVNIPQQQIINEDYINEQLRGSVLLTGRYTTVSLSGSVYRRSYEVSSIENDGYDLSLSLSRNLGSNLTATVSSSYQQEKGTSRGNSNYYDVRFSLSRSLGRNTSAAINYSHHERDADLAADSYTEDRVGVTLTTSFL